MTAYLGLKGASQLMSLKVKLYIGIIILWLQVSALIVIPSSLRVYLDVVLFS